jgi:TonB family protein
MTTRFALCALLGLLASGLAHGQSQSTQKELEKLLKDRVQTLRNFSADSELKFDETGLPTAQWESAPWTLYSEFLATKVSLGPKSLRLSGPRIVHRFDVKQWKMIPLKSNLQLNVEITLPQGASNAEIGAILGNVFTTSDGLSKRVPAYWRDFLEGRTELAPAPAGVVDLRYEKEQIRAALQNSRPIPVDGKGPPPISKVPPRYPTEAREYKFQGKVMFDAEISETGEVANINLVVPAGFGLDESTANAIRKWKYAPMIVGGKPTRFLTQITVNYSIQ